MVGGGTSARNRGGSGCAHIRAVLGAGADAVRHYLDIRIKWRSSLHYRTRAVSRKAWRRRLRVGLWAVGAWVCLPLGQVGWRGDSVFPGLASASADNSEGSGPKGDP